MVVFPQLGTKVDWDKIGEQRLVDHNGVARVISDKDQRAGSVLADILGHDDEIGLRPGHRGCADIVAEFAGTTAGRLLKE
jgi:hypothetical protein